MRAPGRAPPMPSFPSAPAKRLLTDPVAAVGGPRPSIDRTARTFPTSPTCASLKSSTRTTKSCSRRIAASYPERASNLLGFPPTASSPRAATSCCPAFVGFSMLSRAVACVRGRWTARPQTVRIDLREDFDLAWVSLGHGTSVMHFPRGGRRPYLAGRAVVEQPRAASCSRPPQLFPRGIVGASFRERLFLFPTRSPRMQ